MPDVPGRCWPAGMPFVGRVTDAATGKPLVRDGFVCDSRPGDFAFKDDEARGTRDPAAVDNMEFICPRTGKYCGAILVGFPEKPAASPSWQWDGNFEAPTLTPSINCVSGCGWHGWLRAGRFVD